MRLKQEKEKPTFNYTKEIIELGHPTGGNTRIECENVIRMDTQSAASVSGNEDIVLSGTDTFSKGIEIKGYKLYNEDRTASNADFITKIEATTVEEKPAINVTY